jgi:hypothetical protein
MTNQRRKSIGRRRKRREKDIQNNEDEEDASEDEGSISKCSTLDRSCQLRRGREKSQKCEVYKSHLLSVQTAKKQYRNSLRTVLSTLSAVSPFP